MYVTVEDIKRHINVDFNNDDKLIESYIQAAEQAIEDMINVPLATYVSDGKLAAPLVHAIRLQTAKMYEYREGTVHSKATEVPFTFGFLVTPYIVLK